MFIVTGGNGRVGRRVTDLLSRTYPEEAIISVDRTRHTREASDNITFITGDLKERKTWERLPEKTDCIFFTAAAIPWNKKLSPSDIILDNTIPLAHMLDRARNTGMVVFSSSISVYDTNVDIMREDSPKKPWNLYGATKLAGEMLLESADYVKACFLRYSSLYGDYHEPENVLHTFVDAAVRKQKITLYGNGGRLQDFLHFGDAALANVLAYKYGASGPLNIGTGRSVSMKSLAENVLSVFGGRTDSIVTLRNRQDRAPSIVLDVSKAKKHIRFEPAELPEGLRKMKQEMGMS